MVPVSTRGRILLYVSAAIFMLFAIAYVVAPAQMTTPIGISLTASGETDIRATYGGLQAGIALFLFWAAMSGERILGGLFSLFFICISVAIFRGIGVLLSGKLGLHYIGFLFEIPLAFFAAMSIKGRMRESMLT